MPVRPSTYVLPLLLASGMATAVANPATKKRLADIPPAPKSLLTDIPLDALLLSASMMDEKSIACLTSTSKDLHARVEEPKEGLRMVSRQHNLDPTVLDFRAPASLRKSYKGHRNLVLLGMPLFDGEGKDVLDPLHTLADNTEVETLTLEDPDPDLSLTEVLRLRHFPALTTLNLRVSRLFAPADDGDLAAARALLDPARRSKPVAALTSLTIDLDDRHGTHETDCYDLDLAPLLEGCRLQHLDLGGVALGQGASGAFADHLHPVLVGQAASLQSLVLNINTLEPTGSLALCDTLGHLTGLRSLTFRDEHRVQNLDPGFPRRLGGALARMKGLESLDLEGMVWEESDPDLGCGFLNYLPPSVRHLENMFSIEVPDGPGEGQPVPAFMAALERLPLKTLSVRDYMGPAACQALVTALAAKEGFECLELNLNLEIEDEAVIAPLKQAFLDAGKTLVLHL